VTQLLKPDFQLPQLPLTQRSGGCNNITPLKFNELKQVIFSNDSSFIIFILFLFLCSLSFQMGKNTKLLEKKKKLLEGSDLHFCKEPTEKFNIISS
jgi:hypothetical protein